MAKLVHVTFKDAQTYRKAVMDSPLNLEYVRDGSGALRLANVKSPPESFYELTLSADEALEIAVATRGLPVAR